MSIKKKVFKGKKAKAAAVDTLSKSLKGAKAVFVSKFHKLTVEEANELRRKVRAVKATHKVAKNTLAIRAVKAQGMDYLAKWLEGPTAITITMGDMIAPAKVLVDFAKEHEHFSVMGAMLEGQEASAQAVKEISSLPSREVLLAKLAYTLNSPVTRLVRTLARPVQGLALALKAIADKRPA
jgi:large subunit ribosomal protein L10